MLTSLEETAANQANPHAGARNGLSPAQSGKIVDYLVVDDFVSDPVAVRQSALDSGFGTWAPNKGEVGSSLYTGMNFWGDHGPLLRSLSAAVGLPVYPNSMFFRVTNEDTEGAYVHSDREAGDYTAIVYLSKHADEGSGTGFFRHKRSGLVCMPSFNELRADPQFFDQLKAEMVSGDPEHWELLQFIPGRFNRALVFVAPLFHSRFPKHGYGSTNEDGRMIWACHYCT